MKYSIEKFFLSSFWKIIFWLVIFGPSSQAQPTNCRDAFSSPRSPLALAEAMSKNLLLRKNQSALLEGYVKSFFNAKETEYKNEIQNLFNILEDHPELFKPDLREYQMVFFHKEQTKTESLTRFLKSFNSSAGRIKNNLFQIEANWGFWTKALSSAESKNINSNSTSSSAQSNSKLNSKSNSNSKLNSKSNSNSKTPSNKTPDTTFESKDNSPSLSNAEKKELKEKEKQQFLEYLETTPLNKELRQSILAKPKNSEENFSAYKEKTITFYQALSTLRENFQDNPKAFEFLSQAMSDVIHVSGFNNEFYSELLKSKIPSENIKGVSNILLKRDSLAKELGFKEGFTELQSSLNIKHKDNFAEQLNSIEEEINNSSSAVRKEILRLRPLSLQEAPFRGCLGNDCSTVEYFDLALDPNYLYFTLTNKEHQSFGHFTVVLGQAKDKNNNLVKVAFVDKIQAIPTEKITAVLEALRLNLKGLGYKLGLPIHIGEHNDLSNELKIRNFIENEVLPDLKTELLEFEPLKHKYNFENVFSNVYSRANQKLNLLEFNSYKKNKFVEILPGEIYLPTIADKKLSLRGIYQPILSMKNSEKEEEQILFLKNLVTMNRLKSLKISNKQVENHLLSVLQNPNNSLKLRKTAFFTLIQFGQSPVTSRLLKWILKDKPNFLSFIEKQLEQFSEKEKTLILGEMSNWKNSKDSYKKRFISNLHFSTLNRGVIALGVLAHKSPWKALFDINITNWNGDNMLQTVIKKIIESKKLVQWLIKNGIDLNTVDSSGNIALINAITRDPKLADLLIKAGANINLRNRAEQSVLMIALIYREEKIAESLISAGADINAKNKNEKNALMMAIIHGQTKIAESLISAGADLNAKDKNGDTVLTIAEKYGMMDIAHIIKQKTMFNSKVQ